MNLVQKLPLVLTLAACMMMSSCSQEDVQSPQPQLDQTSMQANAKLNALPGNGVLGQLPFFPITNGNTGSQVFPSGWSRHIFHWPDDPAKYPCGTSSFTHFLGNPMLPWITPLTAPVPNASSMVTFHTQNNALPSISGGSSSTIMTKISNLIPGKKYAVTLWFATTILKLHGDPTEYAQNIDVEIPGTLNGWNWHTRFSLIGQEATWVPKTIVFVAQDTEALVQMYTYPDQDYHDTHPEYLQYAHVVVGNNAVQKL